MTADPGTWTVEIKVSCPDHHVAHEFHAGLVDLAATLGCTPLERHIHPFPYLKLVPDPKDVA